MSLFAMPILVCNLGGEMVYILEQRLAAQSVKQDTTEKVLLDVVRTMYKPQFFQELLRPQVIYSPAATRQIFERLVHSSIMKLSTQSMDKLYDLMIMAFKYQLMNCQSPREMLEVTLNHMESVKRTVSASGGSEAALVDGAINAIVQRYNSLSNGELALIRQCILVYLTDRKVRVSLFLQDGNQNMDGTIVLDRRGEVPNGFEVPGTVRVFNARGEVKSTEVLNVMSANSALPPGRNMQPCLLGLNMYTKDRPVAPSRAVSERLADSEADAKKNAYRAENVPQFKRQSTAKSEMNLLASLLRPEDGGSKPLEGFKITNLFPETPKPRGGGMSSGAGSAGDLGAVDDGSFIEIGRVGKESRRESMNRNPGLEELMSDLSTAGGAPGGGGGAYDDILELMDEAGYDDI